MEKIIFSCIHSFSILVMLTLRGCVKMAMRRCPLCKKKINDSQLSVGETSSLKAPSLPSKPLNLA